MKEFAKAIEEDIAEGNIELVKEAHDIETHNCHSDAGQGHKIDCPNCHQTVVFADYQWWKSDCECGEWELTQVAELQVDDKE